jgi:Ca2+-binding EF-hand superfamily protein
LKSQSLFPQPGANLFVFALGTQSVSQFISVTLSDTAQRPAFLGHILIVRSPTMASSMTRSHSHSQNAQASTNYKEAFALFDKRGNGCVALESLGDLLRACGQNPTIAEVRDLEKGVGGDCELLLVSFNLWRSRRCLEVVMDEGLGVLTAGFAATVDFESFQKVLNRPGGFRDPGEPEEYCRGFQVFDKDMTGFIGVGQLRYSM